MLAAFKLQLLMFDFTDKSRCAVTIRSSLQPHDNNTCHIEHPRISVDHKLTFLRLLVTTLNSSATTGQTGTMGFQGGV